MAKILSRPAEIKHALFDSRFNSANAVDGPDLLRRLGASCPANGGVIGSPLRDGLHSSLSVWRGDDGRWRFQDVARQQTPMSPVDLVMQFRIITATAAADWINEHISNNLPPKARRNGGAAPRHNAGQDGATGDLREPAVDFAAEVQEIERRFLGAAIHYPVVAHDAAFANGISNASFLFPEHACLFACLIGAAAENRIRPGLPLLQRMMHSVGTTVTEQWLRELWRLEGIRTGLQRYAERIADFAERRCKATWHIEQARKYMHVEPAPIAKTISRFQAERILREFSRSQPRRRFSVV